jgi:hypothetical protein
MTDAGYDVPKIAERVGRSVKYVYDRLKLLQLIPEAKKLLLEGTITPGHGILLARLSKEDQERALEADDDYRWRAAACSSGARRRELLPQRWSPSWTSRTGEGAERPRAPAVDRPQRPVRAGEGRPGRPGLRSPEDRRAARHRGQHEAQGGQDHPRVRVPDQARDEKERTYGQQRLEAGRRRARAVRSYGPRRKPKPSKTCEYSRWAWWSPAPAGARRSWSA